MNISVIMIPMIFTPIRDQREVQYPLSPSYQPSNEYDFNSYGTSHTFYACRIDSVKMTALPDKPGFIFHGWELKKGKKTYSKWSRVRKIRTK